MVGISLILGREIILRSLAIVGAWVGAAIAIPALVVVSVAFHRAVYLGADFVMRQFWTDVNSETVVSITMTTCFAAAIAGIIGTCAIIDKGASK